VRTDFGSQLERLMTTHSSCDSSIGVSTSHHGFVGESSKAHRASFYYQFCVPPQLLLCEEQPLLLSLEQPVLWVLAPYRILIESACGKLL
jgi:hypothetical protein